MFQSNVSETITTAPPSPSLSRDDSVCARARACVVCVCNVCLCAMRACSGVSCVCVVCVCVLWCVCVCVCLSVCLSVCHVCCFSPYLSNIYMGRSTDFVYPSLNLYVWLSLVAPKSDCRAEGLVSLNRFFSPLSLSSLLSLSLSSLSLSSLSILSSLSLSLSLESAQILSTFRVL